VTVLRLPAARLPDDGRVERLERLERAFYSALLVVAVGLVTLVWPLAETARFALERLFCRES
jgi:hypothetical protein